MNKVFTIESLRPAKDGYTISRDSKLSENIKVTFFSLGKGTSISQESYDHPTLYIGAAGKGSFLTGENKDTKHLLPDTILIVDEKELCGMESEDGFVYTEVILKEKEMTMNTHIKTNEVFLLRDLIDYEEGSISNMDVVSAGNMKYVLMAFDKETGLTPHRAPGNAIVFALEGEAVVSYEGQDHVLKAGECFRFEKNGLHAITAHERFKMALLLVIE